jgi:hypothetical protein
LSSTNSISVPHSENPVETFHSDSLSSYTLHSELLKWIKLCSTSEATHLSMTTSIPSFLHVTTALPSSMAHLSPSSLSVQHGGQEQTEPAQMWLQPPLLPSKQLASTIDRKTFVESKK